MKTEILKTEKEAILYAKNIAIMNFEKTSGIDVNINELITNNNLWLISDTWTNCACGETPAVEVTLLAGKITNECDNDEFYDEHYSGKAGICEDCSSENPGL